MKWIAHIKTLLSMPNWILGGDFNMIMTLEEKKGGTKQDAKGNTIREHTQIIEELNTYYKDLLTKTNRDRTTAIRRVTRHIPSLVALEQNEVLMRPITQEEVDHVVKGMPLEKAPGPDGFTTDLFHHCWDLIREEVWQVVQES
jgi:hypothetical protein